MVYCFCNYYRVPRGPVEKCLTRNPGVLGLSRIGSPGFFLGSVLGQDTSEASLVLVKPRKDMNSVSCRRDMTEILLKVAKNTIQSVSRSLWIVSLGTKEFFVILTTISIKALAGPSLDPGRHDFEVTWYSSSPSTVIVPTVYRALPGWLSGECVGPMTWWL